VPTAKPLGYWKDKQNQKEFLDQLAVKWNIQKPEDWHKVTIDMVLKEGGNFIVSYYNGSLQQGTVCIGAYSDITSIKSNVSWLHAKDSNNEATRILEGQKEPKGVL
jgi:hypothetical protein